MLITNTTLISGDLDSPSSSGTALRIEGERIAEIGLDRELLRRHPSEAVSDARGQYVMPGGICTHTHFYGAFARGLALPGAPPSSFPEILRRLWWPLDRALDPE